ncbi:MAG TPA: metalloregulator ArsR/SmtB family transcription factor [Candidatus Paceibacterota bacterium]
MSDLCKEIARMGKGLGNENRYRILEALMKGPKTVGEIAEKVSLAQPSVSQNLKVLKTADIVADERRGQEVYYSINVEYMTNLLRRLAIDVERSKRKRPQK